MAASRKKKKGQLRFNFGISDERVPKLFGVVYLFIAIYLFIAFFSYLFTWHIDQDRVLKFSWTLLVEDTDMANWLGRLGAVVSNMFFYWGFGVSSFLFVVVLVFRGLDKIRAIPMSKQYGLLGKAFFTLLISSVFLEFVTQGAEFPWGGAFGDVVSKWLQSFLGPVGLFLLFIFVAVGAIVWNVNPNFNELTLEKAWYETKLWFETLFNKRYKPQAELAPAAEKAPSTLRPGTVREDNADFTDVKKEKPAEPDPQKTGSQLAFEMDDVKKK